MTFSIKTRVLLGLVAVYMCVIAAPSPGEAPVRSDITAQAAEGSGGRVAAGPVRADEPSSLDREVVPSLPFTGLDVLTLLGVAIGLTLLAWILHRLSAPR